MGRDFDHYDDHHFEKDNKEQKRNRKALEKKDRSKFKKTDFNPKTKEELSSFENFPKGRVISVESDGAIIFEESTQTAYSCAVKGSLKYEVTKEKNLLTIGDFVHFEKHGTNQGHVLQIIPRISTLYRADNFHRRKMQLIAANIDQVFITVSCVQPSLKTSLIDRYLIAAIRGGMKPIILITKIDLIEKDEESYQMILDVINIYRTLGYEIYPVSTVTKSGLDEIRKAMVGKASVFSGQSGVGKTSLINLITGNQFRTQEIIEKTMKGSHTTTKSHLVPLECGGFCIDTPGIRSFGMWDLKKDEIQKYFPEIEQKRKDCKYGNCTHQNEPGCAVVRAVEKDKIALFRYESYLNLLSEETPPDY